MNRIKVSRLIITDIANSCTIIFTKINEGTALYYDMLKDFRISPFYKSKDVIKGELERSKYQ